MGQERSLNAQLLDDSQSGSYAHDPAKTRKRPPVTVRTHPASVTHFVVEGSAIPGDNDGGTVYNSTCSLPSMSHPATPPAYKPNLPNQGKRTTRDERLKGKLGTGQGVFLPCISQILGVIFFLRLPTITGQAGTIGATLIILVCVLSTFVTSLSLSAIASNGTIQAGGPYYIISRTLGVEIGGSLGLLFYLGTTLGGSMYVMGAVETFETSLDEYGATTTGANAGSNVGSDADADANGDDGNQERLLAEVLADEATYDNDNNGFFEQWFGQTQIYSLALMFLITTVVLIGVKYVNVSANFFLLIVSASIGCILMGTILFAADVYDGSLTDDERVFTDNLWPSFEPDPKTNVTPTFFSLVALFYPSVTGIMAGTNRSAKLATPNKSIPIGTIGAITLTTLLYLVQVWVLGSVVSHQTLLENKLVLACIAYPSRSIVKLGIITACIGAGLQCMAGAPQLLEAIAVDDAIPFLRFIQPPKSQADTQPHSEPTRAIWVTWLIASLATLAGNLDHITPILTMFFLLMYGGINLCCFLLAWVRAPGFRPTFKYFHRSVSLFGFLWCLGMALVISWVMALCAIGLFVLNYMYISNKQLTLETEANEPQIGANWGDVGDSLRYKLTTAVLMKVTGTENFHAKNWRPQLLTVVDMDGTGMPKSLEVLALAAQLKKGRGLNMVISIMPGSMLEPGQFEESRYCRHVLKGHMKAEGIIGFAEVAVTSSRYSEAVWSAVTHSGLGPVSPNIVLLPWFKEWRENPNRTKDLVDAVQGLKNMKRAVALFKGGDSFPRNGDVVRNGLIDIYWIIDDGGLCLLLPYIIAKNKIWRHEARLRVFAVSTNLHEDPEQLESAVEDHLQCVRIQASVRVIDMSGTSIAADMRELASDSYESDVSPRKQCMTVGETFSHLMDSQLKTTSTDLEQNGVELRKGGDGVRVFDADGKREAQLQTAKAFNKAIRLHSKGANLVVTNLPLCQRMNGSYEFMEYIDAICRRVDNILLVRGSGIEVVTTIA